MVSLSRVVFEIVFKVRKKYSGIRQISPKISDVFKHLLEMLAEDLYPVPLQVLCRSKFLFHQLEIFRFHEPQGNFVTALDSIED
jgi:hypothetical protein